VKSIALQTMVLWLHIAVGMSSGHFSFFSPSNIFFIASKISELALLTALFDCGCYTDAKATFVPIWWYNSLNIALSKYCVVDCYVSGYAITADDVLPEEVFD
jgi:NhaP-type Na+/H+ and K+/H+ antiporter